MRLQGPHEIAGISNEISGSLKRIQGSQMRFQGSQMRFQGSLMRFQRSLIRFRGSPRRFQGSPYEISEVSNEISRISNQVSRISNEISGISHEISGISHEIQWVFMYLCVVSMKCWKYLLMSFREGFNEIQGDAEIFWGSDCDETAEKRLRLNGVFDRAFLPNQKPLKVKPITKIARFFIFQLKNRMQIVNFKSFCA